MVGKTVCLLALYLLLPVSVAAAQEVSKGTAAMTAAEKWLALIDGGRYAESWTEAAPYFKNSVLCILPAAMLPLTRNVTADRNEC